MDECQVCYAQIALNAIGAHARWHANQRQIQELTVKNLEGALDLIQKMVKNVAR